MKYKIMPLVPLRVQNQIYHFNMQQYYCKTSTGARPPQYKHNDIKLAIEEAKRLSAQFQCDVEILKVVGSVKWKEVPVTTKKQVLEMQPGYIDDELPF